MANHNKRGLTSSSFERRSTKSEIEILIVLTQSKSSIQKLPTFFTSRKRLLAKYSNMLS